MPDSSTNNRGRDRLPQQDVKDAFLRDGYPRPSAQGDALEETRAAQGKKRDGGRQRTADDNELVARLLKRAEIEGRADDTDEVIRHRLALYHEETQVVVDRYEERGIVRKVDGIGAIDEVTDRVLSALNVNA